MSGLTASSCTGGKRSGAAVGCVASSSATWTTPVPPLAHGEIRDAGYSEFMCSDSFAVELMAGGMTHINGERVTLHIVDELPGIGAVTVRWSLLPRRPIGGPWQ